MIGKHSVAAIMAVAAITAFAGTAQAQYVSSYSQPAPLYPYVVQPQYVYPQPQYVQPYPHVQSPHVRSVPREYQAPRASEPKPKVSKTDPALVEELRKSRKKNKDNDKIVVDSKEIEIDRKVVVREKPVVRKRIRVVDEPPIVVQREIDEHGRVVSEQRQAPGHAQVPAPLSGAGVGRVIHAEAEVTILGPDRMSIRLYRKSDGRDANAKAAPAKPKKTKTSKRDKAEPET